MERQAVTWPFSRPEKERVVKVKGKTSESGIAATAAAVVSALARAVTVAHIFH